MAFLLLAAALASAPTAHATDPIRFDAIDVQNVKIGMGSTRFDLVVEAERLRGVPVVLRALDYSIVVDRVTVGQSVGDYRDDKIKLRKGEPVQFSIPVELDAAEALALATKGLLSGKDLRVRLTGTAGVRILLLPIKIPFRTDLVRIEP